MLTPQESSRQFFFERLPEDKPSPTKPASFALVALISLAIFVAINLGIRTYLDNFSPNFGLWLIRQKWELLLQLEDSQDVLILGDSTADQGLVAEVIQEQTSLKTVNLATVANMTLLNDIWMLNEYLQEHEPPKVVLIMNSYQMWHRNLNLQAAYTVPMLSISNRAEVITPSPDISYGEYLWQLFLHYTPVVSESHSLTILVRSVLQIPPDFGQIVFHHYEISPLGTYEVSVQDPQDVDQDIAEHLAFLKREPFFSEENEVALAALKAIAEGNNFPIYLINAPLADEVVDSPDFLPHFGFIESYLRDYFADNPNVHYIPGVRSYDRGEMESADHLLAKAAIDFTKYIVRTIFQ